MYNLLEMGGSMEDVDKMECCAKLALVNNFLELAISSEVFALLHSI